MSKEKKKDNKLKTIYVVYEEDGHYWRDPVLARNKREAKRKIKAEHPLVKRFRFF